MYIYSPKSLGIYLKPIDLRLMADLANGHSSYQVHCKHLYTQFYFKDKQIINIGINSINPSTIIHSTSCKKHVSKLDQIQWPWLDWYQLVTLTFIPCSDPLLTDCNSLEVQQVGYLLVVLHPPLLPLVQPHADQVGVHELCPHTAQNLIGSILNQGQLSSIENHTHLQAKGRQRNYITNQITESRLNNTKIINVISYGSIQDW